MAEFDIVDLTRDEARATGLLAFDPDEYVQLIVAALRPDGQWHPLLRRLQSPENMARTAASLTVRALASDLDELALLRRMHLSDLPMRDAIRHELILALGEEVRRLEELLDKERLALEVEAHAQG